MYIFDTDTLSNIVKHAPSTKLLQRLSNTGWDLQFTTAINVAEIYYGAFRSSACQRIIQVFEREVFPRLTVLPFDEGTARVFGEMKADLESRGIVRSEPDMRIAAIALQHRLTVITGNLKHFQGIPSLKVENWI